MKRHRSVNLLLMLVLLVAVGQMAQTIYIPAIADMARELNVREGAVQSVMAAYLLTYGLSQLFYGPLSDRVGRRPVILTGMSIFMLATLVAITTHSLTVLIIASAIQGMGTGVGGVMARTLPRDLYEGTQLRHANSLLNMGILVSPLLAPLIGGMLIPCGTGAPVTSSCWFCARASRLAWRAGCRKRVLRAHRVHALSPAIKRCLVTVLSPVTY